MLLQHVIVNMQHFYAINKVLNYFTIFNKPVAYPI